MAEVELLKGERQPWVIATIGTHNDVKCIVDTGSVDAGVLPTRYAKGATYLRSVDLATANSLVKVPEVRVGTVAIGNAKQPSVRFYLKDKSWFDDKDNMPCVLGMDFLGRYTLDLDGRSGMLRLYAKGTRLEEIFGGPLPNGARLDADVSLSAPIKLNISVDGIHATSTIDTGWGLATPNGKLLDALGIQPNDPRIIDESFPGTLSGRDIRLRTFELHQVRIGGLVANNVRSSMSESDMRTIRKERQPYLHIGWDLLRQHRLLLDKAHRDIALIP